MKSRITGIVRSLRENDFKKIVTAIFSEGMLSFSNSIIGILVAKFAIKSEYGMYVVLFSLISLIGGYQNSMFNGPMVVLIHGKSEEERKRYVAGLARGMAYAFLPPLVLATAGAFAYATWQRSTNASAIQIGVLCLAAGAYLSKEFVRNLNFVTFNTNTILRMDLLNLSVVFAGLILLIRSGMISATGALLVLFGGYLAAYVFAKAKSSHSFSATHASATDALKENWHYGKWAILGSTCSLLQDRGYIFTVSIMLGLDTMADLAAARLFFMPLGMLNMGTTRIAISRGSKLLAMDKRQEFRQFLFSFIALLLLVWGLYFGLMLATSGAIVHFVLGPKYANTHDAMLLWGIYFFFYTIRFQLCTGLGAYRQFKTSAQIDIIEAIVALSSCILLVLSIGRTGAILGLILGECLAMVLYLRAYLATSDVTPRVPLSDSLVPTALAKQ